MPLRTRSLRNTSRRERRRNMPYTSSRVHRRSRASRWYSSPIRRSNDASSSSPARRSAQTAAAAALASVTPLGVARRAGAPPCGASAPPLPDPPSAERLSSHLRVIRGKIVKDGTLGMFGVPDPTNGGDAVHTGAPQRRDVLRNDSANGDDRDAAVPHESVEQRRTGLLSLVRGWLASVSRVRAEHVAHHAPRRAGKTRRNAVLERVKAGTDGACRGVPAFHTAREQDLRCVGDVERAARE